MTSPNFYLYPAKVLDVYDGDTITIECDLGFKIKIELKIRLQGINTPEIRGKTKAEGIKARDYLKLLIENENVIIETFQDRKGKYGRYIAKIWLGDLCINDLLVQKGLAIYKDY